MGNAESSFLTNVNMTICNIFMCFADKMSVKSLVYYKNDYICGVRIDKK